MKKLLFLTLIFSAIFATSANAQAGDPPSQLQQMKEKFAPQMVEKTGITLAQAEKIIEINYDMRQAMIPHQNLSDADRAEKIKELKAARDKKWAEVLSPEQIVAVKSFYENMGKNAPPKKD